MTQEDKELLIKDLCARLPYGVKGQAKGMIKFFADEEVSKEPWTLTNINVQLNTFGADTQTGIPLFNRRTGICNFKPYLFPMSSMTDDQLYKLKEITDFRHNHNTLELVEWTETHTTLEFWLEEVPQYKVIEVFDWLNKNHFDYRGLIEKDLAIDATGLNIY